jgi:hypothetical protein
MEKMLAYLEEMHETNQRNSDVPKKNKALMEGLTNDLAAQSERLNSVESKLDQILAKLK